MAEWEENGKSESYLQIARALRASDPTRPAARALLLGAPTSSKNRRPIRSSATVGHQFYDSMKITIA